MDFYKDLVVLVVELLVYSFTFHYAFSYFFYTTSNKIVQQVEVVNVNDFHR